MSTALADLHFPVQTINSNHPGSEFGVVHFEEAEYQMSLAECLSRLAEDGWSNTQEVPCNRAGVRRFLVSRKK
jgi:hypothetical protein